MPILRTWYNLERMHVHACLYLEPSQIGLNGHRAEDFCYPGVGFLLALDHGADLDKESLFEERGSEVVFHAHRQGQKGDLLCPLKSGIHSFYQLWVILLCGIEVHPCKD